MNRRIALAIALLMLVGCRKKIGGTPDTMVESEKSLLIEGHVGDADSVSRHLPFIITKTFEKQKPTDVAPFHAAGGEWTFFDCLAVEDPKIEITVGVLSKRGAGKDPIGWGEAMLMAKDREAADRFIKLFARTFGGKEPKPLKHPFVPRPLSMKTAVFGENLSREAKGGSSGTGGGWTATKWFVEDDEESGEVFFNYNLKSKKGEFSEKDADYAESLLAVFASTLRDGPKPERTPETDANLTRIGPMIGKPQTVTPHGGWHYSFSPDSKFVVFQDETRILALAVDKLDARPIEMARFDQPPWEIHVVNPRLDLVVQEGIPRNPGSRSSDDPARIWWIDGQKRSKMLLRSPEKGLNLVETPISPDGRFVAFTRPVDDQTKNNRTLGVFIIDREKDKTVVCNTDSLYPSVVRWTMTKAGLRLETITNRWQVDNKVPSLLYNIDPATGGMELQKNVDVRLQVDNPLSPDGKRRFRIEKDRLIVTDLDTGNQRKFKFHEDDRRFVDRENIEWVSSDHLKFICPKLALINAATMKMSYAKPANSMRFFPHSCKFSPDFRWVLFNSETQDDIALYLAPIEMPKVR